jgi:hypothetical protein
MKKTTLENLIELKEKLPSFHSRRNFVKLQEFNLYIKYHTYQQDQKLIDEKYNQYLDCLEYYFNDVFSFYNHNYDNEKIFNRYIY